MLARSLTRSPQACLPRRPTACKPFATRLLRHPQSLNAATPPPPTAPLRLASTSSSSSSTRWKSRQTRDPLARDAKLAGLKSRAAFKLLEINDRYRLFRPGHTVVDLGFAPGSWSQVAVNRTAPGGRVVGVDVIPVQPPRGVSTIQGDFLREGIREEVRAYVRDPMRGRARERGGMGEEVEELGRGLVERVGGEEAGKVVGEGSVGDGRKLTQKEVDLNEGRVVDVVLSDMCAPWPLVGATWVRSVSNPYRRMMNTSGNGFRDHAGSMDLCNAALTFVHDTLATGGHFLCKFYQGAEDHALELRLKKLFEKVHRIKPDSSRRESRESYFVCLRRRAGVEKGVVFPDGVVK